MPGDSGSADQEPETWGSQIKYVPVRLVKDVNSFKAALKKHYGEGVTHPIKGSHTEEAAYEVKAPKASTGPTDLVKTLQEEDVLKKEG
ncbi:hypothetical protein FOYG_08914 [Fusarium oxysporum NRRL 32931]|uniref:Uncharacterized protein n=1 Tax=Fusarium oxysporum NRRL 32931 TaxID=660029 RepID=W9IAS3_FUSOX|nr:hypothetical protein FOYG_08914 [Fusarium oxysporum NRRL 32931]